MRVYLKYVGIFLAIATFSTLGYLYFIRSTPAQIEDSGPVAVLAGHTLQLLIADTPDLRAQGLSGKTGLSADEGMLFVFPQVGEYAFWMKDMLFSIDIVWADSDGNIVYVSQNVSPDTYPQTFRSSKPAKYVLELPAGWTNQNNVRIGDIIHL